MSDKDVELDIDGKGSIKIPWKVVLIMLGLAATAMGLGEDAFKAVLANGIVTGKHVLPMHLST